VGEVRRRPGPPPVLITSAPQSRTQEFEGRRRQYTIVMSIRVVCFILAVAIPIAWLRVVFVVGALVLPWVAVIAANQVHGKIAKGPKLYVPKPRRELTDGGEPEPHRADHRS
jgi:hypothetical protein